MWVLNPRIVSRLHMYPLSHACRFSDTLVPPIFSYLYFTLVTISLMYMLPMQFMHPTLGDPHSA